MHLTNISPSAGQLVLALELSDIRPTPRVKPTDDVLRLLAKNVPVAVSISGGKDSVACALAVNEYLNETGHTGERVLINADLGVVEWRDSHPSCERLAAHLGWELITVKRKAGDMLARWQGRWRNNVTRYKNLSCVKVILPWSTPGMRFCTSELKTAPIAGALSKRFPNQSILNVTGIRAEESPARKDMPISQPFSKMVKKDREAITWNAIHEWLVEDVFSTINTAGLLLHEAYTKYGSSRVSCVYCIMSSLRDLKAATNCADNQDVYVQMVELEATSTFAFQGDRWLADVAPHLLSDDLLKRVQEAKRQAEVRRRAEARIPKHLLYKKGWPEMIPTREEAELLASVRITVSQALGLDIRCTTPEDIQDRYRELMALKNAKDAKETKKPGKTRHISAQINTSNDIEEEIAPIPCFAEETERFSGFLV
jgi:3'-phosphoadenosine 5'-phosphosulfate sulfotransferase (PAPS reductase)/FAD synthetase